MPEEIKDLNKLDDIIARSTECRVKRIGDFVKMKFKTKKDIVKIETRFLDKDEINQIALISPNATINEIRDFNVVNKFQVKLPDKILGFPKCINPRCITNAREPPKQTYFVKTMDPLNVRCKYCNISMNQQEIIKQLTK